MTAFVALLRAVNVGGTGKLPMGDLMLLDARPPRDALDHAVGLRDEEMALGKREIFVHYPTGMGRSKLQIPAAKSGTARNMNTVAKLAEIAARA